MCGIIGYTGVSDIIPALVEGLERLEYRGYDSAGVALAEKDGLRVVKSVGRIANLAEKLSSVRTDAHCGIGHTRWATHGRPTEINCHPHLSFGKKFAVVHNGIIENCRNLDKLCRCRGITPVSDTDSELIAHLLELNFDGDVLSAVRRTAEMLEGSFAVAALYAGSPNEIYAFRRSSPLIVGVGDGMCCLASDGCAARTEREYILGDGQYARLSPHGAEFFSRGKSVSPKRIPASDALSCERGGHPHFMIKEIAEQPEAAARTIESVRGRRLRGEVLYLGCGSSYNAALAAIPLTERQTGERAFAMTASEFLFSEKLSGRGKTAVLLSQSGETADTVAAALQAKRRGYRTVCISNVARSSLTRACERSVLTHAGPEISVATTKGFTSQEAALAALYVGSNADEVRRLPFEIERALDCDGDAKAASELFRPQGAAFFIGRRADCGVAFEGALKLREITYIPAFGLSAGELKHGTISLIEEGTPVVLVHTDPALKDKTLLTAATVRARGGCVIAVTADDEVAAACDLALRIPPVPPLLSPAVSVVPLQLLAYYAAVRMGRDVDKPRNLAKSVTVE